MSVQYATQAEARTAGDGVPAVLDGVPRRALIEGQWVAAVAGDTMEVVNPATAQQEWALTPSRVRSDILHRTYHLMIERIDQLAEIMTLEMGKPLAEARGEVNYAADIIRWFAEEAVRIDGGYTHRPDGVARNVQLKQPVGPVRR